MDQKAVKKACCVCLNNGPGFNRLSKKDEKKITLQAKLKTCVQEVVWVTSYYICIQCTNLLSIVYTFRETCLNSSQTRKKEQELVKDYKTELNEDIFSNKVIEKEINGDDMTQDEIKDSIKYEDCNKVLTTTEDANIVSDPLCSSENEQENDESQSDTIDEDYKHKKRRKVAKERKKLDKGDKPTKKKEFRCEKCPLIFPNSTKLIEHCINEHGMNSKDVKPWECDRCPLRLASCSNLWQHLKYHNGIKCEMCSYCGKGFVTKRDLNLHEKRHLRLGEYKCEPCGKSYHTHKDLSSHQLVVHTDPSKWRFKCNICNKPFPIKSNYDTHMARHSREKNFACHLCEKKFTTKSELQRHIKSHSHVREHQCQLCDKEYKDKGVLKVHMARDHGVGVGKVKIPVKERKFACYLCPKAFFEKSKLTKHIYSHSGEKPFGCPICEKKFIDKSYVKQHLRNTHNVEQHNSLEDELKISCMNSRVTEVEVV